jgi:hypothetical protein
MNKSRFFLGPDRDLTTDEIQALTRIQAGASVTERARRNLELVELVAEGLDGWTLTRAGKLRLAQGK